MKKQFILFTLAVFFTFVPAYAQWAPKMNTLGNSRSGAVSWSINDKLYLVGGGLGQDLQEYDPATDTWTMKAALPWTNGYRFLSMGFVIGGKGYICAGTDGSGTYFKDLWMYDPASNTWSARAPLPGPARVLGFAFSIGVNGYVGAGGDNQVFFKDLYEYNSVGDSWTQKSDFPGGIRAHVLGTALGSFGYVGAGVEFNMAGNFVNHADLFRYEPVNDTWTPLTNIPGPARLSGVAFSSADLIYTGLGGNSQDPNQGLNYNDIYTYDPTMNQWDTLPVMPGGRSESTGAFVKGQPYITTGRTTSTRFADLWTIEKPANATGLNERAIKNDILVFPAIATNYLTIDISNGSVYTMKIINSLGQIILETKVEHHAELNDLALPAGLYTLNFSNANGARNFKVIINR